MPSLKGVVEHLRTRGVQGTLAAVVQMAAQARARWLDDAFDRKYGTRTGGIIDDMDALRVHAPNREAAFGYQPIQMDVFARIWSDLKVHPPDFTFVDFGSGKGRAVMMAAERGFAAVHGVEFSPVLHELAVSNCAQFRRKNPAASPIHLACADAAASAIPDGDLVCFFYNPFGETVMRQVLDNLAAACARSPRRLAVAYRNPSCAALLDGYPFLEREVGNATYNIYRARAR